jgi:putative transcriptional regulator
MAPVRSVWGQRIRAARKAAGLSQVQLARAVGVVQQIVSNWECGKTAPHYDCRPRLARVLGVNADELFSYPADDLNGDDQAAA